MMSLPRLLERMRTSKTQSQRLFLKQHQQSVVQLQRLKRETVHYLLTFRSLITRLKHLLGIAKWFSSSPPVFKLEPWSCAHCTYNNAPVKGKSGLISSCRMHCHICFRRRAVNLHNVHQTSQESSKVCDATIPICLCIMSLSIKPMSQSPPKNEASSSPPLFKCEDKDMFWIWVSDSCAMLDFVSPCTLLVFICLTQTTNL